MFIAKQTSEKLKLEITRTKTVCTYLSVLDPILCLNAYRAKINRFMKNH